jgi:protein TonB
MSGADLEPGRRTRLAAILLVAALHIAVILVLIRAFTPQLATTIMGSLTRTFDVPLDPPPAPPSPATTPESHVSPLREEGAAGAPAKRAEPRAVTAPKAAVTVKPTQAPQVAGQGTQNASGAGLEGAGAGGSGAGAGPGSGASGAGTGGGGGIATKPVKIAGDINSASDYPRKSRDLRLETQVVVALRVGTDGRVKGCRVVQASPDAEADRITCRLAAERFRFKPAQDANGNPVEADYGWRQRWFLKTAP